MKRYQTYLIRPRLDLKGAMIHQYLYWTGIRAAVQKEVKRCDVCQRTKWSEKNGKLPANVAEEKLQNKLCVDLIGPYKKRRKGKDTLILKAFTMIYPYPVNGCC